MNLWRSTMREIQVSTAVFSAIWANRALGEEDESSILERLLGVKVDAKKPSSPVPMLEAKKVRWVDDVVDGLRSIGGKGTYPEIYDAVRTIRLRNGRSVPKSFEEVVRKEIEIHSSDSTVFVGREDYFYAPEGLGAGLWALR
jgi:hypothetical protein